MDFWASQFTGIETEMEGGCEGGWAPRGRVASSGPGQGKAPPAESGGFSHGVTKQRQRRLGPDGNNVALNGGRSSLVFRDLKSLAGNKLQATDKEEYL